MPIIWQHHTFYIFQNLFENKKHLTANPMSAYRLAADFTHSYVDDTFDFVIRLQYLIIKNILRKF
jgi:hypothetical protein